MILTATQVAQLALSAGFEPQDAVIAVAIAQAESGFNDQAIGDVALEDATWGPSVGLWQIRTLKAAKGSPQTMFRDEERLLASAYFQALAALAISNGGTNFRPWSTYTSGAYKRYMEVAVRAVNAILITIKTQENPPMPTVAAAFPFENGYVIVLSNGAVYAFGCEYKGGLTITVNGVQAVFPPTTVPGQ